LSKAVLGLVVCGTGVSTRQTPCVPSSGVCQLATCSKPSSVMFPLSVGFGWDSCKAGNWYKIVREKIPELKVGGLPLPPLSCQQKRQQKLQRHACHSCALPLLLVASWGWM
jgi:hypothetical protein